MEEKKKESVTRTRKIDGYLVTLTHVTTSKDMGWKLPMTWVLDFEGTTPQEVIAMAAEHVKIMARAKHEIKSLTENEAKEKFSSRTFKVKELLTMAPERAAKVSLSEDDKRVMALVKKYMDEGEKFTGAYRKAIDEIELEDMEAGEDASDATN